MASAPDLAGAEKESLFRCSSVAVVEPAGREPTRRNRTRSNLPASDATANRNRRTHKKNWQASVGMISAFAAPQFGQVIVDF